MRARVVAVEQRYYGSELAAAASAGAGSITVADPLDFEPDGGQLRVGPTEVKTYTAVNEDTGVITLSGTLAGTFTEETEVLVYPITPERVAHVLMADTADATDTVEARVPHHLYAMLEEGLRTLGTDGESVNVEFEGDELVVTDVTGKEPVFNARYIDPDSFPEQPSDGAPPSTSPTPTVRGTVRSLFIEWTQVANADPVEYVIHVSTSSGFTPDGSTQHSVVQGELAAVSTLPNGTPLLYEVDYFVKIVAQDEDGAAAAGGEGTARLDPAGTPDILAGSITAEKFAAVLLLASLVQTASEGQRVELDTNGIRLYAPGGEVLVDIPTDPAKDPAFHGEIIAGGLDVIGDALFRGTGNKFDAESVTKLIEGIADPTTKPSLAVEWEQWSPDDLVSPLSEGGLYFDTNGGAGGSTDTFWVTDMAPGDAGAKEISATDGSTVREISDSNFNIGSDLHITGVARLGSHVFLLYRKNENGLNKHYLRKYAQSDLAFVSETEITAQVLATSKNTALGTDGTHLLVVGFAAASGSTNLRISKFTETPAHVSNHTTSGVSYGVSTVTLQGIAADGTSLWVSAKSSSLTHAQVWAFSPSTYAAVANRDFWHGITSGGGITWDGTRFWTKNHSRGTLNRHTTWDWTTETAVYWMAYTWYADGPAEETLPSPMASINLTGYRRARVRVTHPDMPMVGGIDKHRHYVVRNATQPATSALIHHAEPTFVTSEMDMPSFVILYDTAGTPPPTENNFALAEAASLQSDYPSALDPGFGALLPAWALLGDGRMDGIAALGRALRKNWWLYEEFLSTPLPGPLLDVSTGAGSGPTMIDPAGHPGTQSFSTGTTAGGQGAVRTTTANGIRLNTGRTRFAALVRSPGNLSDGTNTYLLGVGLCTAAGGNIELTAVNAAVDGVYFQYRHNLSDGLANGNWRCVTTDGSSYAVAASGVAVATNTWYLLEIEISEDGEIAEFLINGVMVASVGSALPITRTVVPVVGIFKSAGTSIRDLDIDFVSLSGEFTTPR